MGQLPSVIGDTLRPVWPNSRGCIPLRTCRHVSPRAPLAQFSEPTLGGEVELFGWAEALQAWVGLDFLGESVTDPELVELERAAHHRDARVLAVADRVQRHLHRLSVRVEHDRDLDRLQR